MKKDSEDYIQIYLVSFLKKLQIIAPIFIFCHVPNGGVRSKAEGAKMKLMGVTPGWPDLQIMARGSIRFIELKTTLGFLSDVQEPLHEKMTEFGFSVTTLYCKNPEDAIDQITPLMHRYGYTQNDTSSAKASTLRSVKS